MDEHRNCPTHRKPCQHRKDVSQRSIHLWPRKPIGYGRGCYCGDAHSPPLPNAPILSGSRVASRGRYVNRNDFIHRCSAPPHRSFQGNYFFRLSRYQAEIEKLLSSEEFVQPAARRNEVGGRRGWCRFPPQVATVEEFGQLEARWNAVLAQADGQAMHPPSFVDVSASDTEPRMSG